MHYLKLIVTVLLLVLTSVQVSAQFLPANKTPVVPLNKSLLSRWIETNKVIHDYQKVIDEMLPTDAEAKAFDKLNTVEQDTIVNQYLQRKGLFEPLNTNIKKLGWTGVADYMRASTQIGNAVAAYLQEDIVASLPPDKAKIVVDKTDPAVKAVTPADLQFVRNNIATIRQHILNYANEK